MRKNIPLFLISAGALALILAGCGSRPSEKVPESSVSPGTEKVDSPKSPSETESPSVIYVKVGDSTFTASLEDSRGAAALAAMLEETLLTIQMQDYGGFEKVGGLGRSLPADDRQTTAGPGDIVLYQGNQIVMFYGSNSWSYTRLAHIDDLNGWEQAIGNEDVTVTFSLEK